MGTRAAGQSDSARLVELGEEYLRLSNLHDLVGISKLLAEEARDIYGCIGRQAALQGMARFRENHPQVWWDVGNFRVDGVGRQVTFDFSRYWSDAASGRVKVSSAVEVLHFDEADLITAITYKQLPSEPEDSEYPPGSQPLAFHPEAAAVLEQEEW